MRQSSLDYLAKQLDAPGSSSPSQTRWQPDYHYPTSFVPALTLNCLSGISEAQAVRQTLSTTLLSQRSVSWSFNYWQRDSRATKDFPYPDDLDDTFCALIGLYRHDPRLIDEAALAQIVHLLLATETAVGGPYRTWLANGDGWQDVDLAVNANIAYFLSLIGSSSPPLLDYLELQIMVGAYTSAYYPTPFPVWYYLARVCPVDARRKLQQDILATEPTNALQLALSICALRQLGAPVIIIKTRQQQLSSQQLLNGSWPAAAYCLDPARDGKKYHHGSAALTTAFALEALAIKRSVSPPKAKPTSKLQAQIIKQVGRDIEHLGTELQTHANSMLKQIVAGDPKHQITLLPYAFAQSLVTPPAANTQFYRNLGLANLYGWMAYTIYDDFIDDEGQPALLPVANFAMRSSVDYFRQALPDHTDFQSLVTQTFNAIDGANAWELAHCRSTTKLPRYGNRMKLAERSLGHSLTPIAVLLQSSQTLHSPSVRALHKAFRHYLIARQLDDDAHDWQVDFGNGHISYVVAEILRKAQPPKMQSEFWYHTLPQVCETMRGHITAARQELAKVPLLKSDNAIVQLLDGLETSVQSTLVKQSQASKFLASYQQISNK
jgi:hypothetical protein